MSVLVYVEVGEELTSVWFVNVCLCVLCLCISIYELSAFGLQAEFGDYEADQPRPLDYISQRTFAPNQNKEMEEKILELHKSHRSERTATWSQK